MDRSKNTLDESPAGLKKFGLTMVFILGIFAFFFYRHQHLSVSVVLITLMIIFLILSFLKPLLLRLPQKLWMGLAFLMGGVMTRVLMLIIFYGIVTPLGICAKLSGQNLLRPKNMEQRPGSFWIASKITKENKEDYLYQF